MDQAPLEDLLERGYRYALALAHDRDLAQDLLQDVCLAISRRGGPWTVPYLLAAVRNRFIDHQRRRQRAATQPLSPFAHEIASPAPLPTTDPGLEAALRQLPPDDRDLLYLAVVEGYTAAALAEMTGRPRGTILSTLHRAKQKLRRLLTERPTSPAL